MLKNPKNLLWADQLVHVSQQGHNCKPSSDESVRTSVNKCNLWKKVLCFKKLHHEKHILLWIEKDTIRLFLYTSFSYNSALLVTKQITQQIQQTLYRLILNLNCVYSRHIFDVQQIDDYRQFLLFSVLIFRVLTIFRV